jgi:uncharacterized protein (TIGR03437 family)
LAGAQVLFDGIPAPILSAAPSRIDAVVPFGVATSGTATISVLRNGASVAPKLFTNDGTGYGAAAWNQDGTPNSASNPAKVGDIVTFYGTGMGAMTPAVVDGTIPQSPQSTTSQMFTLGGGQYCPLVYSGDAPGLVEGIVQFNCQVVAPLPPSAGFGVQPLPPNNIPYSPQIYTLYVK